MDINDITGITISHNTAGLLTRAIESVRRFHPTMKIMIVDGSDVIDPCRETARSMADKYTEVYLCNHNIGHGRGMDFALRLCKTRLALIFDTDIVMILSPVNKMIAMIDRDTYGIGYVEKTGYDGFEYGSKPHHKNQPFMYMLHPFFHMLVVDRYFEFHPYVHHGAPCFKAALDIHKRGLTDRIIKILPELGHTAGKGWVWSAIKPKYIIHDTAGTRKERRRRGLPEIEIGWQR